MPSLEHLLWEHLRRYPGLEAQDLAKLLYQGAMGMDHLLRDRERFLAELAREWAHLDPVPLPGEVVVEPIHPRDPVVRVHLRPLKAAGVDPKELGLLLASQPLRRGRVEDLAALWEEALALARAGKIPVSEAELAPWGARMLSGREPPPHSPRYRELHRPAYRLLHNLQVGEEVLSRAKG